MKSTRLNVKCVPNSIFYHSVIIVVLVRIRDVVPGVNKTKEQNGSNILKGSDVNVFTGQYYKLRSNTIIVGFNCQILLSDRSSHKVLLKAVFSAFRLGIE